MDSEVCANLSLSEIHLALQATFEITVQIQSDWQKHGKFKETKFLHVL